MYGLAINRKRYIKDVYVKYWITAREKIYGFLEYDKSLCRYICEHVPNGGKLLEVAIGTGYPFADFFQKAGYSVSGIDISPDLIEKCRQLNPNIKCQVGDAEKLDYTDDYFDVTYCFHSTWYFPNLNQVIDEMLRVTRPGGIVIFDIENLNNEEIDRAYRKRLSDSTGVVRMVRYAKEVVAWLILGRRTPIWNLPVYEVPTYPESVYGHLEKSRIANFQVMVRHEDESIETRDGISSFEDFARLVFTITK
ncbi:MAG: class I SAM-dependent methyltransferase [Chloroflexi bacterium]|nr:class I SAM-dependent methyltransferase [Chloroflexota bacterium]